MLIIYILLGLISLSFLVQLYFHLRYFSALAWYKIPASGSKKLLPVSVIVCARNESENLQNFLDSILTQEYPDYEVVVVNDCSYDLSSEVLKGFKARYQHLKVVELEEDDRYKHGKKFALTLGIKAAKNEHLLMTDADCEPVSKDWIKLMQEGFHQNKEIVLGHSPYFKAKGFLNTFSRFETFYTAFQYMSFSLRNKSYMGVGRNLAYTKTLFFKNKGFAAHMHIMSGDDDLFVNQVSTQDNTMVCLHPDSFVMSPSKIRWSDYFRQKMRHLSAGKHYKSSDQRRLSLIASSGFVFYLTLIAAIVVGIQLLWVLPFYFARLILIGIFYYPSMKKLGNKDLFWFYPILDILYYLLMPFWAVLSLFLKQLKWK